VKSARRAYHPPVAPGVRAVRAVPGASAPAAGWRRPGRREEQPGRPRKPMATWRMLLPSSLRRVSLLLHSSGLRCVVHGA